MTDDKKTKKKDADKEVKNQIDAKTIHSDETNKTKSNKFALKVKVSTIVQILIVVGLLSLFYFKRELFIVAEVNGQPIKRIDLISELEKTYGKATLDTLITKMLVEQEGKKQGIVITDEDMATELKSIEETLGAQNTNLESFLELQGLRLDDLKAQIRLQKIVEKIVGANVSVTDEEVNEYIASSPEFEDQEVDQATKDQIKDLLKQQKMSLDIQAWLQKLREDAKVSNHLYPVVEASTPTN